MNIFDIWANDPKAEKEMKQLTLLSLIMIPTFLGLCALSVFLGREAFESNNEEFPSILPMIFLMVGIILFDLFFGVMAYFAFDRVDNPRELLDLIKLSRTVPSFFADIAYDRKKRPVKTALIKEANIPVPVREIFGKPTYRKFFLYGFIAVVLWTLSTFFQIDYLGVSQDFLDDQIGWLIAVWIFLIVGNLYNKDMAKARSKAYMKITEQEFQIWQAKIPYPYVQGLEVIYEKHEDNPFFKQASSPTLFYRLTDGRSQKIDLRPFDINPNELQFILKYWLRKSQGVL
ncbi:MAG: hypothetical protein AAFY71_26010 [Bacteroidota bacterium]